MALSKSESLNRSGFSRADAAALLLSVAAVIAAYLVAVRVFDQVPHLEDEIAYVWQAKAMAAGAVTVPSPELPKKFLVPFVIDHEGLRFGKYPLGWPALLSVGITLGIRAWINPMLAGFAVWFTYRLGRKFLGEIAGLVAAVLTLTSPFFLMNAGSLLSHLLGLVLALWFVLAWWDTVHPPDNPRLPVWLPPAAAGLALGALGITRPFTAVAIALPFMLHGAIWLLRGDAARRKRMLTAALIAGVLAIMHFAWQAVATGDPFLNPYELWWPYDRVGFGPGFGVTGVGHTLRQAWLNTIFSTYVGWNDLFGWAGYSWLLLPFGLLASRRNGHLLWPFAVVLSLLTVYMAYWIGAWTLGPRYQFEGLFSLTLMSAAGFCWLAGLPHRPGESYSPAAGRLRFRRLAMTAGLGFLIGINLVFYLPPRLAAVTDLYGISGEMLAPFAQAEDLAPAVIVVHADYWTNYGGLLQLEDPFLQSLFIFVWGDQPGMLEQLRDLYPERSIYHYYPEEPGRFYTARRGE